MPDKGTNPLTRLYDRIDIPETSELVWWCSPNAPTNGHLMTSFQTKGYGQVDFAPARTFIDVTRICWDVNETNLGHRKWKQVVVVPETVFQANKGAYHHRLDYIIPRVQDGPGSAGLTLAGGVYVFESVQGNAVVHVGQNQEAVAAAGDKSNADKATRLTTCLDRVGGQTRVTQERLNGELVVRTLNGQFPAGPVRVVFQDDNYNPSKSCESENDCPTVTNPLTWHWDAIQITHQES